MVSIRYLSFTVAVIVALSSASLVVADASSLPRVDAGVHRALRAQGTVDLIVTMKQSPKAAISSHLEATFESRGDKISSLVEHLGNLSKLTQAPLQAVFAQESSDPDVPMLKATQSFWISNQVFIEGASPELVRKLSEMPSLAEVREQLVLPTPQPIEATASNSSSVPILASEWGVAKISAPGVWTTGNTGQKVVVSTIDTGVLYTHEALKANFRASYNWYDPAKKTTVPTDENGHGTHTMGTIAGSGGIGVAPGATWIACRGCTTDGCAEADLLACAQFIMCPTDVKGENKDCTKAPHVVSNSWGGGQGDTFYQAAVDMWIAAGIIPVFANGNEGPNCGTANSPADYANVIAVGATDSRDALADFSSKGPSKGGLLKPDISAPGSNVRSAWNTDATSYKSISGTSMATPHVAGLVALLLNANPELKFNDVKRIVTATVDTSSLQPAGKTCGNTADDAFPNNNFGYGRVNALKAVQSVKSTPAPAPTAPGPAPTSTPTSAPAPASPAPAL